MLASIPTLPRTCEALAQRGVQVLALQRYSANEDFESNGVRYVLRTDDTASPSARPFTQPSALLDAARAWQPDVLHVNGLIFPVQIALARARLGRKVRIVVQHHGERPPASMRLRISRLLLRAASGFIFNGAANAAEWRAGGIIRASQPVFEAVEASSTFAPLERASARVKLILADGPMVLWVGRLIGGKDPLTALRGFEHALQAVPNAHFYWLYTDDALLDELRQIVDTSPALRERVHFVGAVPHVDMPLWFSACDAFVSSSLAEGSNYSLIEATACGAPPVCSNIAPHRFLVADGAIGAIGALGAMFDAGDAMACGDALARVLAQSTPSQRQAVRAHFDQHLSWPAVAEQLESAYRSVLRDG